MLNHTSPLVFLIWGVRSLTWLRGKEKTMQGRRLLKTQKQESCSLNHKQRVRTYLNYCRDAVERPKWQNLDVISRWSIIRQITDSRMRSERRTPHKTWAKSRSSTKSKRQFKISRAPCTQPTSSKGTINGRFNSLHRTFRWWLTSLTM